MTTIEPSLPSLLARPAPSVRERVAKKIEERSNSQMSDKRDELFARIQNDFAYHAPSSPAIADRHTELRNLLRMAAVYLYEYVPLGREQDVALTKLEEAMFWANAAVARTQSAP